MTTTVNAQEATHEEKILAQARDRFNQISAAEYSIRAAALEDIRFTYNVDEGQWPDQIRTERERDGRPCLTANKLRKFVAIVANQERENRIAVKIVAVDAQSDPDVAQVLEDLVRQIEYQSGADVIYASTGEQAAAGGFGYWRLLTKFVDDGFDQEILLQHIDNPFSVYLDPRGNYGFITDVLPMDEFEAEFPKASRIDFNQSGLGEEWTRWYERDKIRVAEYFTKEPTKKTIVQVRTPAGATWVIELKDDLTLDVLTSRGFQVLRTREVDTHKIRWYKITGHEILEERDWPGRSIPIIEVVGDRINVAGKIHKRSLVRDGKDPQRMYNYWLTTEAETVALQPKAPFVLTPQEIAGHEAMWDDANRKNYPYLLFNGLADKRPTRVEPPKTSPGHQSMMQISQNDIKDTLGMFESFLGERSNERSGTAIFARERRSQIGVFQFPDNLRRAIVETGRQLIDMIPRIYDTERIVRLRNEEGTDRLTMINETIVDPGTGKSHVVNDISLGKYDVLADVRLYSTRRQETTALILQAMQFAPQVAPALIPLLFKFMDSPGAKEIETVVGQILNQGGGTTTGSTTPPTNGGLPPAVTRLIQSQGRPSGA